MLECTKTTSVTGTQGETNSRIRLTRCKELLLPLLLLLMAVPQTRKTNTTPAYTYIYLHLYLHPPSAPPPPARRWHLLKSHGQTMRKTATVIDDSDRDYTYDVCDSDRAGLVCVHLF
jgi:hypothetical protein